MESLPLKRVLLGPELERRARIPSFRAFVQREIAAFNEGLFNDSDTEKSILFPRGEASCPVNLFIDVTHDGEKDTAFAFSLTDDDHKPLADIACDLRREFLGAAGLGIQISRLWSLVGTFNEDIIERRGDVFVHEKFDRARQKLHFYATDILSRTFEASGAAFTPCPLLIKRTAGLIPACVPYLQLGQVQVYNPFMRPRKSGTSTPSSITGITRVTRA